MSNSYPKWEGIPNCRSTDPEAFFTQDDAGTYNNMAFLTKICNNCEVKTQCLDYALHNQVQGWWGGSHELGRRKMRKALGITPIALMSIWDLP